MNWSKLTSVQQLEELKEKSHQKAILIFKHSTRCSISRAALDRLERSWKEDEMQALEPVFLDLIAYRDVSNQVANVFDVVHESPQAIVIQKGQAVYDSSHFDINYQEIKAIAGRQPVTN